jgi:hypothetical protein
LSVIYNLPVTVSVIHVSYLPVIISVTYNLPVTFSDLHLKFMIHLQFVSVFTTFNYISVISWRSVLLVEETEVPGENHRPVVRHGQTLSHNILSSTLLHLSSISVSPIHDVHASRR